MLDSIPCNGVENDIDNFIVKLIELSDDDAPKLLRDARAHWKSDYMPSTYIF